MSKPGGTSASNIDQLLDRSAPTLSLKPEPGIRLPAPGGSINPSVMLPHFRRARGPPASACRDAAPASVTDFGSPSGYVGEPLERRRDLLSRTRGAVRWAVAEPRPTARTPSDLRAGKYVPAISTDPPRNCPPEPPVVAATRLGYPALPDLLPR